MDKNLDRKWFIAQVKPNSYNSATQNLERQGFETFVPRMEITKRQKNKFIVKIDYVFPGYIFVSFQPHALSWNKINNTYGISKIIAFNNKPSEISSDLIFELKKKYQTDNSSTKEKTLRKGDAIKFYNGPFVNFIAKIESVDKNSRIWVLLEIMGTKRRLKLNKSERNNYNLL